MSERWQISTVGEVCDILSGYGFPKHLQGSKEGDYPFYKVSDISQAWVSGRIKLTTANNYLSKHEAQALKAKPFPAGTTILAKIGEAIKLNRRAMLSMPSLVDNNVIGICPKAGKADPKYIYYFLLTVKLGDYSQATTVPSVRKPDIAGIALPLAPLEDQKCIVAEIEKQFSRLDEAVASLKRIQANLKRYKAAVLKAAVEGKLTEQWRKDHPDVEPAAQLLKRILAERRAKWEAEELAKMKAKEIKPKDDSWKKKYKEPAGPDMVNLPELPKEWVWASLDQITSHSLIGLDRGKEQQNSDGVGVPYVKMNNVTMDGQVLFENLVYVQASKDEISRFLLEDGDVLFNTRNSKELVGKVGLVRNMASGSIYNNNLMRIRFSKNIDPSFVCSQMCSDAFRKRMELVKKATTNVAAVYAKDLFPLQIVLPHEAEQHRIVTEVEGRLSVTEELENTIETNLKRAARLRQVILQMAYSGKLITHGSNVELADVVFKEVIYNRDVIDKTVKVIKSRRVAKVKLDKVKRPLIDVIEEHKNGIAPEALLVEANYSFDEVDTFYEQLSIIRDLIDEEKHSGKSSYKWPEESLVLLKLKRI